MPGYPDPLTQWVISSVPIFWKIRHLHACIKSKSHHCVLAQQCLFTLTTGPRALAATCNLNSRSLSAWLQGALAQLAQQQLGHPHCAQAWECPISLSLLWCQGNPILTWDRYIILGLCWISWVSSPGISQDKKLVLGYMLLTFQIKNIKLRQTITPVCLFVSYQKFQEQLQCPKSL